MCLGLNAVFGVLSVSTRPKQAWEVPVELNPGGTYPVHAVLEARRDGPRDLRLRQVRQIEAHRHVVPGSLQLSAEVTCRDGGVARSRFEIRLATLERAKRTHIHIRYLLGVERPSPLASLVPPPQPR